MVKPRSVSSKRKAGHLTDSSRELSTDTAPKPKSNGGILTNGRKKKRARQHEQGADSGNTIRVHFPTVSATSRKNSTFTMAQAGGARSEETDLIMNKLSEIQSQLSGQISQLTETVDQMSGEISELRRENDELKRDLEIAKETAENLQREVSEAKFQAALADRKVNDLEQYGRRNNVRVFGILEDGGETSADCERKVLKLFNVKLGLSHIGSRDIEAAHRVGPKPKRSRQEQQQQQQLADRPRAIIVRFLSRKVTEEVLHVKRKLKNTGFGIAEDLTKDNYQLLQKCREHPNTEAAWTKHGTVCVETKDGRFVRVKTRGETGLLTPVSPTTSTPETFIGRLGLRGRGRGHRGRGRLGQNTLRGFGRGASGVNDEHSQTPRQSSYTENMNFSPIRGLNPEDGIFSDIPSGATGGNDT